LKSSNDQWFKSWFNTQDYLDLYKHRDARDAKKIVSLVLKHVKLNKGANVLDLACGNGRHSILFAKKRFNVTGIDLSNYLINQARKKLSSDYAGYRSSLRFEIQDMRNLKHVSEFDLVVNIFTSFGYFESDSDNEKVIGTVAIALKRGGYFLIDFLNRDYLIKNLITYDVKKLNHKLILQVRTIKDNIVEKNIIIIKSSRNKKGYPLFNHFTEKIKLYSFNDFEAMFSKHGLNIIKVFGSYTGSRFIKEKSERLIIIARKA
jgi:SAM-dependent methyltransferase